MGAPVKRGHNGRRRLPDVLGEARLTGGGVYVFRPGGTAHPEPGHVHAGDEVFIFLQGFGFLPIDGTDAGCAQFGRCFPP
jgi:hypothetical protein